LQESVRVKDHEKWINITPESEFMMDPKFKRSQSVDKREAAFYNSHQKNHLQNNNGINIHNQNRKEFKPSNKN